MRRMMLTGFVLLVCTTIAVARSGGQARSIPRTWDDGEIARHEVPLADAGASPKHVSSDYYYRIPVRPIYKGYQVYAPGREPAGYLDWVRQQEPVVLWDDKGHSPALQTESDWIRAGEIVFDAPLGGDTNITVEDVRNAEWLAKTATPVANTGILPWFQYIVRRKGVVELGNGSCAFCHTRVLPGGTTLKGAQGNLPVQRAVAFRWRAQAAAVRDPDQYTAQVRTFLERLHAFPALNPDPETRIESMSIDQIASLFESFPPGAAPRHRGNSFTAIQIPDLIGVKERRYLDRTGLEVNNSVGDLMRYAAMNQGADGLASYGGFVPAGERFEQLPGPETSLRYSDEQLFALVQYLYSLRPPKNPNRVDAASRRGRQIFQREQCGKCHTPPLYTNNRLTPAPAFDVPADHLQKFNILRTSVGTDPELAMRTRRGTGYYKVPSLKGVWYRSMFGHSGWCATLEDWFDPRRQDDDYVPTSFRPYGRQTYPVQGHPSGLDLSEPDRRALIAFLKTL
jgi:hypothetical protein